MRTISVLFCALMLAGCSRPEAPKPATTTPLDMTKPMKVSIMPADPPYMANDQAMEVEFKKRWPDRLRFFTAAKNLVDKTKSNEAAEVLNFTTHHSCLALPVPGRRQDVQKPTHEPYFSVVVLKPEDERLGPPWSNKLKDVDESAEYDGKMRVMILQPEHAHSDEELGLDYIHEAYHAYESMTTGAKSTNTESFYRGEIGAIEFEGRLIVKLHPKTYGKVVDDTAALIERFAYDRTIKFTDVNKFVLANIDRAFERKVTNTDERNGLCSQIFYQANFRLVDKLFATEAERQERKVAVVKLWLEKAHQAQGQK